ncbi:DM13 domain-containing protein [Pseudoalteromonas prydzensis]|jgi:hypothetical protein|nr:DM13 domain-containing protein [Pseudoalteromonas prydzensis]
MIRVENLCRTYGAGETQGINIADFNTVIVWCESFNEFISAAQYQ